MGGKRAIIIGAIVVVVAAAVLLVTGLVIKNPVSIRGAVVMGDPDPAKEIPIGDVEVTVVDHPGLPPVRSDDSGLFTIPLGIRDRVGLPVALSFKHPDYLPLVLPGAGTEKLYVARLTPLTRSPESGAQVKIANVTARYSMRITTSVNIGSAVKTFQIANTGNAPCQGARDCSPDGKWKAATGSATIDAGEGNEFRNVRASCIAGPCPFTKVLEESRSHDNRTIHVTALNWSDTVTYLIEAEVYRPMSNELLRQSYPVIFDRAFTFSLPAGAEGVSVQAELDGTQIVFPLGPTIRLSWATCQVLVSKDRTQLYRCELKPGYRFS